LEKIQEKRTNWVNGIDSIRFVLAFIVLLSHLHDPFVDVLKAQHSTVGYIAGVLLNHMFCGAAAVSAFFVISGFVIHYPNRHKSELAVILFLLRRWLRIGIPLTVICAVAAHYRLLGSLPLWSLYCELIYYTVYPVLFRLKVSWKTILYLSFAVSFLFILLFIADEHHLLVSHRVFFRGARWYLAMAIISFPSWVLGVLLAIHADDLKGEVSRLKIWTYRLFIFGLSTVFLAMKMHLHINFSYSLVFYSLILYKWLAQEIIYYRTHNASPMVEYLGKFSYSVYLCHSLCFALIAYFFANTVYTWLAYILLSMALSYIAYLLVEYPSHRLAQKVSYRIAAAQKKS